MPFSSPVTTVSSYVDVKDAIVDLLTDALPDVEVVYGVPPTPTQEYVWVLDTAGPIQRTWDTLGASRLSEEYEVRLQMRAGQSAQTQREADVRALELFGALAAALYGEMDLDAAHVWLAEVDKYDPIADPTDYGYSTVVDASVRIHAQLT